MPTKYELVSYLSSLISILDSQDDAGAMLRSSTISDEYKRGYDELKGILAKEREDEARERKSIGSGSDEARADFKHSLPIGGQPLRELSNPGYQTRPVVREQGRDGPNTGSGK